MFVIKEGLGCSNVSCLGESQPSSLLARYAIWQGDLDFKLGRVLETDAKAGAGAKQAELISMPFFEGL